jgi:hypothetical protein
VPLATESADSVVIKGDGWEVTTGEVAEIVDRVEEILGDELLEPAVAFQADDIGAGRARGFEFIEEDTWLVLQRLGTAPLGADRRVANQTRLDRIQGLCCEATGGNDVVVVEAAESEPMTKAVIAHQLTEDEQADVLPYLGIFSPEQRAEIGEGAADFMEFGYQWGPRFMEAVEAEGGRDAVLAVMLEVPTSSAQVLFPDKFFAGEEPPVEGGSTFRLEGTLGAATLLSALAATLDVEAALELLEGWRCDRFTLTGTVHRPLELADPASKATDLAAMLEDTTQEGHAFGVGESVRFIACA